MTVASNDKEWPDDQSKSWKVLETILSHHKQKLVKTPIYKFCSDKKKIFAKSVIAAINCVIPRRLIRPVRCCFWSARFLKLANVLDWLIWWMNKKNASSLLPLKKLSIFVCVLKQRKQIPIETINCVHRRKRKYNNVRGEKTNL